MRKEISNEIARIPSRLPRQHIVAPKLEIMEQCINELDSMIIKLVGHIQTFFKVPTTKSICLAKAISKTQLPHRIFGIYFGGSPQSQRMAMDLSGTPLGYMVTGKIRYVIVQVG
jgi:hypothetical protein